MKTTPDHDELLHDVFSEVASPAIRAASLERALRAVRRQRTGRRVLRVGLALAVVVIAAAWFWRTQRTPIGSPGKGELASAPSPPIQTVPGTNIRLVSDDELLAMFPDRPVALLGPPDNRQFVFLDEQRKRVDAAGTRRKGLML